VRKSAVTNQFSLLPKTHFKKKKQGEAQPELRHRKQAHWMICLGLAQATEGRGGGVGQERW